MESVKKYHPDSGNSEASPEKFQEVDNAFRILQEKFAKRRRGIEDDEDLVKEFDIKHTAPQHRQYLSFDGIGMGTPAQRQNQSQQARAMKAQERVLEHRVQKSQASETDIMKKGDYFKKHAIKTKGGFDRVVEDLIQEAMAKGEFQNLGGVGKPLPSFQSQNHYVDFITHKINTILLDNGFTPEWITLQKDIRENVNSLKANLVKCRSKLGPLPFSSTEQRIWNENLEKENFHETVINKKIDNFNLIVPILNKQMFRISLEKIAENVLKDDGYIRASQRSERIEVKSNTNDNNFISFIGRLFS